MKTKLLVFLSFFLIENTFAQLSTEIPLLPLSGVQYMSVNAADLDGDLDLDIIGTPYRSSSVYWFENKDGLGSIGVKQFAGSSHVYLQDAVAADIDNDGDMDIFSASGHRIVWIENTDGKANFGPDRLISNADGATDIMAIDMDGDGDMDLLTNSHSDYKTIWYENTDGKGSFVQHIIVTNSFPNLSSVSIYATDFDGDGDVDVLESYNFIDNGGKKIVWYENIDGLGNFGSQRIIQEGELSSTIFAGDIDGDGDNDVVAASRWSGFGFTAKLSWYENIDGLGNFGPQQIITDLINVDDPRNVKLADIDLDGDMDVFLATYSRVILYENLDGLGNFGPELILAENEDYSYSEVIIKDFNGDGNPDVLASNFWGLSWWENLMDSQSTDGDGDGFNSDVDCDDTDATAHEVTTWYLDFDKDNYAVSSMSSCTSPGEGYTTTVLPLTDCDDNDGMVHEVTTWYLDFDKDNFAISSMTSCTSPGEGYTTMVIPITDCDDSNPNIYPGAPEIPNNDIDEDCDGQDLDDGGENCSKDILGELNLNPSRSANNIFIMETPDGRIDMNTLASAGSNYKHSGIASSIKIKVKAQGRTLKINGSKITLRPNIRYEFSGALTVSLYNRLAMGKKNKSNGHWWIGMEGINICIKEEIRQDENATSGDGSLSKEQTQVSKNKVHVYPNQFSDYCNISYKLNKKENVSIQIYDLNNRFIKDLKAPNSSQGDHNVKWNGTNASGSPVSNGVYIIQFTAGDFFNSYRVIYNGK